MVEGLRLAFHRFHNASFPRPHGGTYSLHPQTVLQNQIFDTGYGPLDDTGSAPVSVVIGGARAHVLFSGPVKQFPGLWQINAQIPAGLAGQLGLYLVAGNAASNAVTVWAH